MLGSQIHLSSQIMAHNVNPSMKLMRRPDSCARLFNDLLVGSFKSFRGRRRAAAVGSLV